MPIPPPPAAPRAQRSYGGLVGVALLVAAVVFGTGYVLLAGRGTHSYDRHPSPPAQVRLTAGKQYLLSTVAGPGVAPAADPLACTYTTPGGSPAGLQVTAEKTDSRATHAVATFVAPVSGPVSVGCTGGAVGTRPVFVDDADGSPVDVAGILLLLGVVCAVPGAGLVLGALYRRTAAPRPVPQVSGVTDDPGT